MTPWYLATQRFGPACGERWAAYVAWSGLTQLSEVVSLDGMLCPTVLPEIRDEDWAHVVNEDFLLQFFVDFEYLREQVAGIAEKNVLCVFREPVAQPEPPAFGGFQFLGYDLMDQTCGVSALTNCGGFPGVFDNSELSAVGLLRELERACEVRRDLRRLYPEEHHADCQVWAIFRGEGW